MKDKKLKPNKESITPFESYNEWISFQQQLMEESIGIPKGLLPQEQKTKNIKLKYMNTNKKYKIMVRYVLTSLVMGILLGILGICIGDLPSYITLPLFFIFGWYMHIICDKFYGMLDNNKK